MKKFTPPFFLLLLFSTTNAQLPKIDISFRKNKIANKAKHYLQMLQCKQQKTTRKNICDILFLAYPHKHGYRAAVF
jgi:hypothetical protein